MQEASSDNISVSDIEGVIQKAIAAATEIIREEFTKLYHDLSKRVKEIEDSLNCITTEVFNYDIVSLDRRIKALEDCPQPEPTNAAEDLRRDICEIRISANENEQYSRRQNLRIKGLTVAPEADCRQKVINFCWSSLHIQNIAVQDIDVAHPVVARAAESTSSSTTTTSGHTQRTDPVILVRFHQRQHRDLVLKKRRLLKESHTVILEDLTSLNIQTLNRARNSPLVTKTWSWNGKIYSVLNNGKKIIVKPFSAIQDCEEV